MGIFNRKKRRDATLDLRDEAVIDLTATQPPTIWGFPSRCPECGDYGYLDRIDLRLEVMYQHCPTCWHRWETPRSATIAEA